MVAKKAPIRCSSEGWAGSLLAAAATAGVAAAAAAATARRAGGLGLPAPCPGTQMRGVPLDGPREGWREARGGALGVAVAAAHSASIVVCGSERANAPRRIGQGLRFSPCPSWQGDVGHPAHAGNGCWRAPLPPAQSLTSVRPLGTACVEAAAAQHHGPRRLHRYPRLHGPRQAGDPLPPHCGRPGAPGLPRATGAAAAAASATARSGFGTLIVGQQRIFNTSR